MLEELSLFLCKFEAAAEFIYNQGLKLSENEMEEIRLGSFNQEDAPGGGSQNDDNQEVCDIASIDSLQDSIAQLTKMEERDFFHSF